MANYNIPGQNLVANELWTSPEVTIPEGIQQAKCQITDPNNRWGTTVGNVVKWGLQISKDAGANWDWWIPQQEGLPFGTVNNRDGSLPAVNTNSELLVAEAGSMVRIGIIVDTDIRLGFTISTIP